MNRRRKYMYECISPDVGMVYTNRKMAGCSCRMSFTTRNSKVYTGYDPEKFRFVVQRYGNKSRYIIRGTWADSVYGGYQ